VDPSPVEPAVTYVPVVTGFSVLLAESLLTQAGLAVGSITTRPSGELTGVVLESQPPAYSPVQPGSVVNLVVAAPL
jgi:beta-lactam-binding protein with PASTA domain